MRVAVFVNGIYPSEIPPWMLMECHQRLQRAFEGCDFYYQMWDTDDNRHRINTSKFPYPEQIFWTIQPKIDYNPYVLAIEDNILPEKFVDQYNKNDEKFLRMRIYLNRTAQHLGFQNLWQSLTEDYDYYYRVRWDTWISNKFDLKKSLDLVDQGVVGYNISVENGSLYAGQLGMWDLRYDRTRRMREITRDMCESGKYTLVENDNEVLGYRYDNFLSDFCIGFKRSDYEGNALELSSQKKLYPAEWGWHQLLAGKRRHINVNGLAAIVRIIDPSLRTFLKVTNQKVEFQ